MTFANLALLTGFVFLAVPPILHLLNRRKYDVVDWAAMRFLKISQRTRKKIFLEELLLMLFRMLLLAVVVMALAGPKSDWRWLRSFSGQPSRDIVLIVDGSLSMGYGGKGKSSIDAAGEWTDRFIEGLRPGDRVALILAKQRPVFVVPTLSADFVQIKNAMRNFPMPKGGVNWPDAVQQAMQLLAGSPNERRIVLLTDGQAYGWSDENTLVRWELLSRSLTFDDKTPGIAVVNVSADRKEFPTNWSVGPIASTRPIVPTGREVTFKSELILHWESKPDSEEKKMEKSVTPKSIKLLVDERPAGDQKPLTGEDARGRIPFSFVQRFAGAGSHLVSAIIDDDALPGDNRRDYSIDVIPTLPLMFVDGDDQGAKLRGSDFLHNALAPAKDTSPGFLIRVVAPEDLPSDPTRQPIGKEISSAPRVILLSDVRKLTEEQVRGLEKFATEGGGILITLGPRVDAAWYNSQLYRDGKGLLPARLVQTLGSDQEIEKAPQLVPQSLEHPALELFKDAQPGGLASAYFPKHWKLEAPPQSNSSVIASLNDRTPFFVEKNFGKGRVVICCVPLDNTWRTNLTDLGDFVRLSHELMYYMAGGTGQEKNLQAGQPIVFSPTEGETPQAVTVIPPEGASKRIELTQWPLVYDETRDTGVYRVQLDSGKTIYYVVQPDPMESILTLWSEADRQAVGKLMPNLIYASNADEVLQGAESERTQTELWWLFLLFFMLMLCVEIYFTRRIAVRNPPIWD